MAGSRFAQAQHRIRPVHIVLAAAIVALGLALRVQGAMGELWLDELWSLDTALKMQAWHEVFWTNFSDNSHPLNTAWMHLMGAGRSPWVYRLEAIVLSTITIAAAGWTVIRHGSGNTPVRLLTAMLLLAVLYPFVHFGSEARGYAAMMLFAILAFAAAEDATDRDPSARWRFCLWGTLGLFSHLGSVLVMAFLALGYGLSVWPDHRRWSDALRKTVHLAAPYAAVLIVFILIWLRDFKAHDGIMAFGGGTDACDGRSCFVEALGQLVRLSIGGHDAAYAGLAVGLATILTVGAVAWLAAVGNRRAGFYAALLVMQPLLFFILAQPALPYGRYLLGVFIFWPLLMADVVAELSERGYIVRTLTGVGMLILIALNAWSISQFLQTGRGDYAQALKHMTDGLKGKTLRIGTNMAFQFSLVMDDLVQRQAPDLTVDIYAREAITRAAPEWLVTVTVPPEFMAQTYCEGSLRYTLVSKHPYWGFSGSSWGVYRLIETSADAAQPALPALPDCPSAPHPRTRFR